MANPKCRFIFLCEAAIQKTTLNRTSRSFRKGRKNAATGLQQAEREYNGPHWPAAIIVRRLRQTGPLIGCTHAPPAPPAPRNADLSRLLLRFDTTENALVTSSEQCGVDVFAVDFSKCSKTGFSLPRT
ncbi:unnamed protein product [Pieris brassicae]|uniref:Uncharacterized protein n=1 Tax=Pieris brassicae TaxID=7116 RepID=A0A9P0TLM3_PIEBR|nr:unnamed protein product [Pieris brassicae]